jgi:AcrR family transcriptional regulator
MNVYSVELHEARMETRADRTAETRERIQRAALQNFVEQGIDKTSIRDIADTAHISLGAMYNHFKSKDELARELFLNGWNEIGEELRRRAAAQPSFAGKMRAMIGYVFKCYDEDWVLVTYIFSSRHRHLQDVRASRGNPYMMFRMVIADAMRKGAIPRGDLDLKTALIVGGVIQAIDSRILVRLKGPLANSAPAAAEFCVRALGGAPD